MKITRDKVEVWKEAPQRSRSVEAVIMGLTSVILNTVNMQETAPDPLGRVTTRILIVVPLPGAKVYPKELLP